MIKGTDFVLDALVAEGLDHLFMIPGGLVDPFLPALARQPRLRPIVAAQEGGAAYMADGYARARGGFGAALGIGGPGLMNMVTAIATAQTDGAPVIVFSGEVAKTLEGHGMFQDASSQTLGDAELLRQITRYSSSVDQPGNLPNLLRRALLEMHAAPCGPVHLSLPTDVQRAAIDATWTPLDPALLRPRVLSAANAEATLPRFQADGAGQPPVRIALLVGAGVEHAEAQQALRRFAERWDIPVATTLRAKGLFPEDHPLSLGVFGYAGTHHARLALLDAPPDLLVVLGSGLNERDTMQWSLRLAPAASICVNVAPAVVGREAIHDGVVGDACAYLRWLLAQEAGIGMSLETTRVARRTWLDGIRAQPRLQDPDHAASEAMPIHPARVVAELRVALPRDGILLVDSGAHRAFAGHYWTAYEPRTYISATNLGPMGWAIPAAVGVQCAQPQRKVAVITGDGCMHMHGLEVATAARYRLPIVYVVVNNGALGNVWLRAHEFGPVPDALTRLPDLDWARVAEGLGCRGETVRDPAELAGALARALAADGPTVVDVKADRAFATPVADWAHAVAAWSFHE